MRKALDKTADILLSISGILFFIIFAINISEIICRTCLNHSLLWVTDISTICVVWSICLSIAACVHYKEHLFMNFLTNALPERFRKSIGVAVTLISIGFFIILCITGTQTALSKSGLILLTVQWSLIWPYLAVPVFALFSAIFLVPRLFDILRGVEPEKQEIIW